MIQAVWFLFSLGFLVGRFRQMSFESFVSASHHYWNYILLEKIQKKTEKQKKMEATNNFRMSKKRDVRKSEMRRRPVRVSSGCDNDNAKSYKHADFIKQIRDIFEIITERQVQGLSRCTHDGCRVINDVLNSHYRGWNRSTPVYLWLRQYAPVTTPLQPEDLCTTTWPTRNTLRSNILVRHIFIRLPSPNVIFAGFLSTKSCPSKLFEALEFRRRKDKAP